MAFGDTYLDRARLDGYIVGKYLYQYAMMSDMIAVCMI